MAKKISQLTQATQVKSDDVTVIVQDGETKKLPLNMMVTKQDIENKKIAGLAKLDEIEATYENDTYTPTITVKNKSSVKTGEGDEVDYSANVMDGHAKSAILKGNTGYRDIDTGEFLETFEEGRNLELVSVKMPVLKTIGKNIFSPTKMIINDGATYGYYKYKDDESVRCTLSISDKDTSVDISEIFFGISKSGKNADGGVDWLIANGLVGYPETLAIVSNNNFISIYPNNTETLNKLTKRFNIQLEHGEVKTTYEPYKSNILSCNEEVTLRGIGEVKDTLDGNTGELTQRIGEVVLDGSQSFSKYDDIEGFYTKGFYTVVPNNLLNHIANTSTIICDQIKITTFNDIQPNFGAAIDSEGLCVNGGYIKFRIDGGKASTVEELNTYLSKNPIKILIPFIEPTIRTVDLMPSGTHPSTTPYCWKNGHIQLSSSGLLPNLEYSVVTSRAGQINQNATMIVKNDKRIFDLEILLAGGLVNTTYQALTLQNQVETGLSKVSLNSETEPDYLLYHMIMKLIEEKAYKLDDLTEKVSVFYLYEKLSDEQFETIYSALYPFVEDEIVEEPVVEELPEVVEDEVIM